jgi:phosphomannomutase
MATLRDSLTYDPVELAFGTSGLRGLVTDMTDLECYINTTGFLEYLRAERQLQANGLVLIAGDLRDSTPRILGAVKQAIEDGGYHAEYHGLIPTPAIAYYALQKNAPCIMITGSHIPADRNGIKFYKQGGEVLKADEPPIQQAVATVRAHLYSGEAGESLFDIAGRLRRKPKPLSVVSSEAEQAYEKRYLDVFPSDALKGKKIVFYQHSSVGRDLLPELFTKLGAVVVTAGRSDVFIPIDSENVTPANQAYFKRLAIENPGLFAIVSTDGDSDRPFVVDEIGIFHRGDVLGAVTAKWCQADFAAYPVSTSDAVDTELAKSNVPVEHTKIGSPYVVEAMDVAYKRGLSRVVGWEVNGGFLLGTDLAIEKGVLKALPTRDAFLPILVVLLAAIRVNCSVSELFGRLPQRFTDAGLIDNFPVDISKAIVAHFGQDSPEIRAELATYFSPVDGFGTINAISNLDGVRIAFESGDIAHLRPSSNAPQLRVYSVADTQARAAEIVNLAIAEPDGIFRRMQASMQSLKSA